MGWRKATPQLKGDRMEKGQEARVERLPKCDFCGNRAAYDAKTKQGPWANMCETHWRVHAESQQLGIGMGQRLVLDRDF